MKKGSLASKLMSSFFIVGLFKVTQQDLLWYYAWIHYYCRSMPRGGGCLATVPARVRIDLIKL